MEIPQHSLIMEKLDYFYQTNKIPHIIFYGASGTGKRTIVHNFVNRIYDDNKARIKTNVMSVNCAHGKGIKFIREDLKFFAKTNIQSGVLFKTIILLNADSLTIDAQSALRRCIELFSGNTRFFIIVENKNKLLNPIVSRFCEIYVPEYVKDGAIVNLHTITPVFKEPLDAMIQPYIYGATHVRFIELCDLLYEAGHSALDIIKFFEKSDMENRISILICFEKIKSEFRCEKLLMLYILDFAFLRSNTSLNNISFI